MPVDTIIAPERRVFVSNRSMPPAAVGQFASVFGYAGWVGATPNGQRATVLDYGAEVIQACTMISSMADRLRLSPASALPAASLAGAAALAASAARALLLHAVPPCGKRHTRQFQAPQQHRLRPPSSTYAGLTRTGASRVILGKTNCTCSPSAFFSSATACRAETTEGAQSTQSRQQLR